MSRPNFVRSLASLTATATLAAACSFSPSDRTGGPATAGGGGRTTATGTGTGTGGSSGGVVGPGNSGPLPADFTRADVGGYKRGAPVSGSGATNTGIEGGDKGCNEIVGLVRDFKGVNEGGHPDFEAFHGNMQTPALVGAALGSDRKPVYGGHCDSASVDPAVCPYGQQLTTKASYDQWYRNVDAANKAFLVYFWFEPNGGVSTFQSNHFFPLDGAGWGNSGQGDDGMSHNFGFTTELHTRFKYQGGEHFTFIGDDDLWVFVNGKLAMDLGGLHPQVTGTIDLDKSATQLGIAKGSIYPLELFHAERHTVASNFRVDTNFLFVDCGTIVP